MRLVGLASINPSAMVAPLPLMSLVFTPFTFAPLSSTPVIVAAIGHRDGGRCIRDGRRSDVGRLRSVNNARNTKTDWQMPATALSQVVAGVL